jgi:hypothetical protein
MPKSRMLQQSAHDRSLPHPKDHGTWLQRTELTCHPLSTQSGCTAPYSAANARLKFVAAVRGSTSVSPCDSARAVPDRRNAPTDVLVCMRLHHVLHRKQALAKSQTYLPCQSAGGTTVVISALQGCHRVQLARVWLTLQPAQHRRRQSAVCDEADHADADVQHTQRQLEGTAHHICWHHQQLFKLTERNCQLLKAWLVP